MLGLGLLALQLALLLLAHKARCRERCCSSGEMPYPHLHGELAGSNTKRVLRSNVGLTAFLLPRQDATASVAGDEAGGTTNHELRVSSLGRAASDCHLEVLEK